MPGVTITVHRQTRTLVLQFLGDHLRLMGTHVGCDTFSPAVLERLTVDPEGLNSDTQASAE
jgi:aerobic-type carbon monoxide dehydrogenase small subunit (CoxS/CutS family)